MKLKVAINRFSTLDFSAARRDDYWRGSPRGARTTPAAASYTRATAYRGVLRTTIPRTLFAYRNGKHLHNKYSI